MTKENITDVKLVVRYTPSLTDRIKHLKASETITLEKGNEFIDFEFCGFIVKEFTEANIMLRLVPKKQGMFKFEALLFSIFDIPRKFNFDNPKSTNRNFNG